MTCADARGILWPPERPRLLGGTIGLAREHVRSCEACTDYLAQDRAILEAYERARSIRAPGAVRERVFDALAGARWGALHPPTPTHPGTTHLRSRVLRAVLPVVAVVITVTGLVYIRADSNRTPGEGAEVFVEDYLRRAVGQDHIETNDPAEVMRFLERELGLRFTPIRLAGLDLARAEICLLEGRRGAMIVYKKDGAEVAHYVVPRDDSPERAPALSTKGRTESGEMPVVTWATPNVEQALVGGVGPDELLRIAWRGAS